jgi:hypothetical protein
MIDVNEEAIVAEARAKFPAAQVEIVSVKTRVGLFVLRSPTTVEHRRFQSEVRDDVQRAEAFRNLFCTIAIYPTAAEVTSSLDRFGGLLAHPKVQNAVAWLTGQADELQGKSWPAP